ncbi:RsfA family transcriptional regulator [Sporolactobacillus shoreae]|uniref:RsfA family transcriptional regulator n=1 Tax=Sporolactobacillus shoreae TaxID=1465501 RepID=A0A4Z0GSL9_9BACL|nr:RsfA family transcriptional regulator [Sporolactobacillus shoreae]TGA99527.1 RsfA family transcriptional regulator [Sporolactobacillus shoreae]
MTKVRQDAWSHEDDLLLAETVLRHIREGSTQLDAFEEVGDRLNRTGAACGFRWNAIVRRKYEQAIGIAKKQRRQKKRDEQRTRVIHPASAVPSMETAYMEDPAEFRQDETEETVSQQTENVPVSPVTDSGKMGLSEVISYLQTLQRNSAAGDRLEKENSHLKAENSRLLQKVDTLEKEVGSLQNRQQTVEDDYQALIGIMDRARRMVAFQDQDSAQGATFKMDQNGNLEKIAK